MHISEHTFSRICETFILGPSDYERQRLFLIKVTSERGQVVILITCTNGIWVTLEATQAFSLISLAPLLMRYCYANKPSKACTQWMNESINHAQTCINTRKHTKSTSRIPALCVWRWWLLMWSWLERSLLRARVRHSHQRLIGQGRADKSAGSADVCHKATSTVAALRFMAALSVIAIFW